METTQRTDQCVTKKYCRQYSAVILSHGSKYVPLELIILSLFSIMFYFIYSQEMKILILSKNS